MNVKKVLHVLVNAALLADSTVGLKFNRNVQDIKFCFNKCFNYFREHSKFILIRRLVLIMLKEMNKERIRRRYCKELSLIEITSKEQNNKRFLVDNRLENQASALESDHI